MPPKGKDAKKGAPVGNYKAGKLLKDILPPNTKPPREGQPIKVEGEPQIDRSYDYKPYPNLPDWPSTEEIKNHDFSSGSHKNEDGTIQHYVDHTEIYLPPSFLEFERGEIQWLRPDEYLREIAYDNEVAKRRNEKKTQIKKKRTMRKQSILALGGGGGPSIDELTVMSNAMGKRNDQGMDETNFYATTGKKDMIHINKEEIQIDIHCITYDMRLENEDEVKKRKEEAEKLAALDKNAKKAKPPPKGQPVADPMDEPQMIKVPIENTMDMGFTMPLYTKWVTSQFQFIKDRTVRDVDTRESIWQRIYPQENGIPVISPSGKYWVKLRFMGKEKLVEIDDRMPCDSKRKPFLPRTINNFEIWPQILMKALLKVYSYKWYKANALYDTEVGDGSIVYSLTGLIPEPLTFKDFEKDGLELLRKTLSDDHYFNKKTYVTCYCENEYRPKLPSQTTTLKKIDFGSHQDKSVNPPSEFGGGIGSGGGLGGDSETSSVMSATTSGRMLGRLRDAATLAISVTTGRKLHISDKKSTGANVITGFGYALMDIFENQFVDMDAIVKKKDEIEEVKSPFLSSPAKKRKEKGLSKDEFKKKRREEKKKEQEEKDRKEKEPPKQFSLVKVKTSVGRYPVMNYLSTFTNDEITEAKKCLLNHMRRPPELQFSPGKFRQGGHPETQNFALNVQSLESPSPDVKRGYESIDKGTVGGEEEKMQPLIEPKTRAAGGVWLLSSDIPHSFQHIIVYHNLNKYTHVQNYSDRWTDHNAPYISNEKDVLIKLELDEEALKQQQLLLQQNQAHLNLHLLDTSRQSNIHDQSALLGGDLSRFEPGGGALSTNKALGQEVSELLPGEVLPASWSVDQILLAYAPYPTNAPASLLPRYLLKLTQVDHNNQTEEASDIHNESSQKPIDLTFRSYFEGRHLTLNGFQSDLQTIWLKPNIVAPQGYTLWGGSLIRKISIVPRSDYLIQQKGFHMKSYQIDILPLEKGKYQMFAKYDFQITDEDTTLFMKVDVPTDKYLLKFMRLKIINKNDENTQYRTQTENQQTLNTMKLENMKLQPNDGKGYTLVIEGVMPYNTTENQLQIEVLSNKDTFALEEVQHIEPVEYSDKYFPSKYGIIFKEKVFVGPDHTSAAINIKLKKSGKEFGGENSKKLFRLEVLDQGKVIYKKEGYNQITVSHFMFRSNQGLVDAGGNSNENGEEYKHAYVIQAIFDLYEWPECVLNDSDHTNDITWHMKLFSSETLAIVKDTDKEDRERALKASWEQNEPGRAEKARKSKIKFVLQQRLKNGEQLTEEEMAIVNEVRERIRKKDEPEQPVKGGAKAPAKGAPAKGGAKDDPKAKGKAAAQPIVNQEELDEKNKRQLPEPADHVNNEIRGFLEHYKSDRLIYMPCDKSMARKRDDQERISQAEQRQKEREQAQAEIEAEALKREVDKEQREKYKQKVFGDFDAARAEYKDKIASVMADRNKYREMIAQRKDKEKAIQDLLLLDKIDLVTLQKAIDEARDNLVREEVITRGEKQLVWLKYCKEVEQLLQQAVQEKNKENLLAVIDRIEKEQILIEPKMLNDAKNTVSKIK